MAQFMQTHSTASRVYLLGTASATQIECWAAECLVMMLGGWLVGLLPSYLHHHGDERAYSDFDITNKTATARLGTIQPSVTECTGLNNDLPFHDGSPATSIISRRGEGLPNVIPCL